MKSLNDSLVFATCKVLCSSSWHSHKLALLPHNGVVADPTPCRTQTMQNGDVHISVSAVNVLLGTQLRELAVFPQTVAPAAQTNREQTAEQQLQDALGAGDAVAVVSKGLCLQWRTYTAAGLAGSSMP
jgi:hypothetical protein